MGLVIGSGASTLRAIKNQCGVDINIPQDPIPDDPSQRSVEICGDGDKIERAIKMILDIVAVFYFFFFSFLLLHRVIRM